MAGLHTFVLARALFGLVIAGIQRDPTPSFEKNSHLNLGSGLVFKSG